MDIGKPQRIIEVTPIPIPEKQPEKEPEPAKEPEKVPVKRSNQLVWSCGPEDYSVSGEQVIHNRA